MNDLIHFYLLRKSLRKLLIALKSKKKNKANIDIRCYSIAYSNYLKLSNKGANVRNCYLRSFPQQIGHSKNLNLNFATTLSQLNFVNFWSFKKQIRVEDKISTF